MKGLAPSRFDAVEGALAASLRDADICMSDSGTGLRLRKDASLGKTRLVLNHAWLLTEQLKKARKPYQWIGV
jgi:hypothetical protein